MERSKPGRRARITDSRARITDRDETLLEFLAEHRIVLSAHVQKLLGVSVGAADSRLRALRGAGLVESERLFHAQPGCWWITRKGLAAIDSSLPAPRLDLHAYRHDVGVAWLWLAARRGVFGHLRQVVSEREMRSRDGAEAHAARAEGSRARQLAIRLGGIGPGGRERLHYPDLLLVTKGGRRVAVELELSTKGRTRRERILAGYGADNRIDAVLYLVDNRSVARAVQASAARLGITSRVQVQRVQWGDSAGRAGGRAATRLPAHALNSEALQR